MPEKDLRKDHQNNFVELPKPYEGVFEEVLFAFSLNRADFISSSLTNLRKENSELSKLLLRNCFVSPNQETSLSFSLFYYEIFSRSAKKAGNLMPIVSQDLLNSFYAKKVQEGKAGLKSLEELEKYHLEHAKKQAELIGRDSDESSELENFWVIINIWQLGQFNTGKSDYETIKALDPLFETATVLHQQSETNKLRRTLG